MQDQGFASEAELAARLSWPQTRTAAALQKLLSQVLLCSTQYVVLAMKACSTVTQRSVDIDIHAIVWPAYRAWQWWTTRPPGSRLYWFPALDRGPGATPGSLFNEARRLAKHLAACIMDSSVSMQYKVRTVGVMSTIVHKLMQNCS